MSDPIINGANALHFLDTYFEPFKERAMQKIYQKFLATNSPEELADVKFNKAALDYVHWLIIEEVNEMKILSKRVEEMK